VPAGTAIIDFGNAPAQGSQASVAVTGQTGILTTSQVEAWIMASDSVVDPNGHSADEQQIENVEFRCGNLSAGVGFTIYGECWLGTVVGKFKVNWVWV
jgi:hypothetical protein